MRQRSLIITGTVLLVLGIAGLAASVTLGPLANGTLAPFSSNGQRIYYTGADANGPIPWSAAGAGLMGPSMMGTGGCVDCHGEDGRGGRLAMMYAAVTIPDIRYSALTSSHAESGTVVPGWTDSQIAAAIRDGVEPSGQKLLAPMPRWALPDIEMKDLIDYLKELDKR